MKADKIEKVCKLITETIIDLFNNKESELDNLRKEIEKLDSSRLDTCSVGPEQSSGDIDKLMEKLMDPDMQLEIQKDQTCGSNFNLSPILWTFIKVHWNIRYYRT